MSKIQINYKSGNSVVFEGEANVKHYNHSKISSVELEDMLPRPLFLGLADVESVWVLEDGNEKE